MRSLGCWLLCAVTVTPLVALAQEGKPAPSAQSPSAPAAPAPPAAQAPPVAAPPAASQPAATPPAGGRDDIFVPTQQLSADEAVTFPADI
jgi:hypothetical protein